MAYIRLSYLKTYERTSKPFNDDLNTRGLSFVKKSQTMSQQNII